MCHAIEEAQEEKVTFVPCGGALRCPEQGGCWLYANPHDVLYSTISMVATEYWDGLRWVAIWPETLSPNDVQ